MSDRPEWRVEQIIPSDPYIVEAGVGLSAYAVRDKYNDLLVTVADVERHEEEAQDRLAEVERELAEARMALRSLLSEGDWLASTRRNCQDGSHEEWFRICNRYTDAITKAREAVG